MTRRIEDVNPPLIGARLIASQTYRKPSERPENFRDELFDQQKTFFWSEAKRRAALCGRRGGKTVAIAYWLVDGALATPGEQSRYISVSKSNCRDTVWMVFGRLSRERPELGLYLHEVDGQLTCTFPNGSEIKAMGCKNRGELEKFRGLRYKRVVVDEAGSCGEWLEELIEDVLDPAMVDLDGETVLSGSPPPVPQGYFWEVTTGNNRPKWETHAWTMLDNPYIPHAAEWLRKKRESMGWTETHPRYVREYLGQWVYDAGALVFPFQRTVNGYRDLPPGAYRNSTGIDFGYIDSCAWVAGSYVYGKPTLWVRESYSQSGMAPSEVAERTSRWRDRWPGRLIGDSGGPGKAYIAEMARSKQVYVEPAQKHDKRVALEFLRGDIQSGAVKVHLDDCATLLSEATRVQWNEDHTDIDKRSVDHECHALLYLHRDTRLVNKPELTLPEPGTPAAITADRDKLIDEVLRRQRKANRPFGLSR